jgi:hypothetical protein
MREGKLDPCVGRVIRFEDLPLAHYEMGEGEIPPGNTVALVGASEPGLGRRHVKRSTRPGPSHVDGSRAQSGGR